jgi:DNA-binding transcriptional LysR family regulator
LRQAVDEITGVVRGKLVAGMITGCEVTPWFDALAAFHGGHPGVDIELREDNSDRLIAEVTAGEADIALVGIAGAPPGGLGAEVIVSEGLAALVPPDHQLAGRSSISLADLASYPLVCLPVGTGIRSVLDQACAAAGLRPMIALEASSPTAVADLGARGLGVAVLSRSMAAGLPGRTAVPITGVDVPALLALVWRRTPSPVVAAFLPHCRRAFRR